MKKSAKVLVVVFAVTTVSALLFQNCAPNAHQSNFESENSSQPPVSSNDKIVVGDMLLDRNALSSKGDGTSGAFSNAAAGLKVYNSKKWPNGIIPVQFKSTITSAHIQAFFDACNDWAQTSSVKCVNRTTESDYVYVTDDVANACYTDVGAYNGVTPSTYQKRTFNYSLDWCWDSYNIRHELGHVIGLIHEHQRPDRDNYVTIHPECILNGYSYAFDKFSTTDNSTTYDYTSIMEYHSWAYSIKPDRATGCKTIAVSANSTYTGVIGEATDLSNGDRQLASIMYPKITATPTPAPTPISTATPRPSPTPVATATPKPSPTPIPTSTPKRRIRNF